MLKTSTEELRWGKQFEEKRCKRILFFVVAKVFVACGISDSLYNFVTFLEDKTCNRWSPESILMWCFANYTAAYCGRPGTYTVANTVSSSCTAATTVAFYANAFRITETSSFVHFWVFEQCYISFRTSHFGASSEDYYISSQVCAETNKVLEVCF